ncbi:hypothetical protein Terro_3948 [Terriglobus roseus DSM 18391]|uniref:Ava_C0101 and related proteins n=1 Tax=Terriglobus roseus (strain DSM 18391 / NRRL B-41598 / KBS 63) TaxID=926566 RepID=I3ZLN8_TERRK|nr:DUF5996 family protein [Terriglobus roseus]AFL90156.1 hypothetical protein Terro_3948 [Terriglobus roseus DSM 18391]
MALDSNSTSANVWPELAQSAWSDSCVTLQLWTQVVGKIRLALTPAQNHTWSVALYPTARGLTTSPMWHDTRVLQIDFDFIDHKLILLTNEGDTRHIALGPMSVASFYGRVMEALESLGMPVRIWPTPVEVAKPVPFDQDLAPRAYDPEYVARFWQVLLQTTRVFNVFRARFIGKVSPVHLFWGALDLACTRFSGRTAPQHPGVPGLADRVTRDAYSHEVSSCGFWPGAPGIEPLFYSYAYPSPEGFKDAPIQPAEARFDTTLGEFVFPYEAMRQSADPDAALLQFLQSTYEAAADTAHWDRQALESPVPRKGDS